MHFQMVKDLGQCYELNSQTCDEQSDLETPSSNYTSDVLIRDKQMWIELFLHLSDVSNPTKMFATCQAWAWRVLDEFFLQGDEEKKLGVSVGMLNDRDKVSRPGSQHGFITFLVAPLITNAVKIFPPLDERHSILVDNLEAWCNAWREETNASREDYEKKMADV